MGGLEIPDNGERMVPAFHHEAVVYAEHIVRYLFAARFVLGKQVLDVGSGVGYGADLLRSAGAAEVVALDRSPEAVRYGKEHHSKSSPAYVVGDAGSLPFHGNQFELIVSFETIEHVPDYQRFLAEVKRVLRADGLFIVSTPNRSVYVKGNPFHTKEFALDEFEEALAHHFRYVRTFSQDDWIASAVLSPEEMEGADRPIAGELSLYKAVGKSPLETLYMVSLCSEAPIPQARQEVVLTGLYEMRQYLEELARRDAEIERSRTDLTERDALLQKKEQALAERGAALRELQAAYQGLRQNLDVLQRSLGYRLLQGYRRGVHRVFPPGSLRASAYLVFVQGLKAIVDRFERLPRGQRPHR
jgi:2-polyprenyl-3-methyl-5-hydroxy-6-metoxy-1,4-benzoquinol methylase